MNSRKTCSLVLVAAALAVFVGASESRADPCSASASALVSRSAGGTCPDALALNEEFTLQYRITNASIVDDPGGPNDGTQVAAVIPSGKVLVATLAQETAGVGGTALPGTLQFIPVCSVGSAGGALAGGDPCDPSGLPAANCGSGVCGCVSNLAGVTCTLNANPNKVTLTVGSDIAFTTGQLRNIATIRVKATATVPPPAVCGQFFTRLDSTGDVLVTDDVLCDNPVTAGAQASANLQAPECTVDSDCGDAQCNQCADLGTDNHCAVANIGGACGSDSNPDDCLLPACVDVSGTGVCQQGQTNEADNTPCGTDGDTNDCLLPACQSGACNQGVLNTSDDISCSSNLGVPVAPEECQAPLCTAGVCANEPDATQDNDPCGTDTDEADCKLPACQSGTCNQGVLNTSDDISCSSNQGVPVGAVECQAPLCTAGVCANEPDATQNNDPCGTDADTTDCKLPACQSGSCNQGVLNTSNDISCSSNLGVPVPPAECQAPLCAAGVCANEPDATQDNDPCGTDADTNDCKTPACQSGTCNQGVLNTSDDISCSSNLGVPVPPAECQAPLCTAGVCANEPDATQDNDPCGTDADTTDCKTPACQSGACNQGVLNTSDDISCSSNLGVPVPPEECQAPLCTAGVCANEPDASQNGNTCTTDGNVCTDDECLDGSCQHTDNTVPCDDGLFCTTGDQCTAGSCVGTLRDCSDGVDCTDDLCNDTTNQCDHTPNNGLCDDADECTDDVCTLQGCDYTQICGTDICRSPGYWATHSGYEKKGSINVGQLVIDAVGPLEVCGQTITSTSNPSSPYLAGLGLTSDIEALCMKGQGVQQRQLYRQLVAAALNCAVSGDDCDTILAKYLDVSFSDCDAVCAGDTTPGLPTAGKCIGRLDCFNNGGLFVDGHCTNAPNSCHTQPICNPDIGVCPAETPASSSRACQEARGNGCTIDSCP